MDKTTIFGNVKARTQWLLENGDLYGEGAEWVLAVCEELERMTERIEKLEQKGK
jgi:hypothetical protein